MILIKPNQISGEIMTLLDEADERVVIVSPYIKISKWYKLLNKFKALQDRGIPIEFYVRENEIESIEEVQAIGITPIPFPNLHAKLYMNESCAVICSMNLTLSSEISSLDIGYKTTTKEEYNDVLDFYNKYIKSNSPDFKENSHFNWREYLHDTLSNNVGRVDIYENEGEIQIKTKRNNYSCFIWNEKRENLLRMCGILSNREFQFASGNISIIQNNCGMSIELIQGNGRQYDTIWGTYKEKKLNSTKINNLVKQDERIISDSIVKFVIEVENIKSNA